LIYNISDIIIYHEAGLVNNQTLNSLTSLCIFADMITDDMEEILKPELYFRMRDFTLDDGQEIVDKTLRSQEDQYDGTRRAIKKLFPIVKVMTTDSIRRTELTELKQGNFKCILDPKTYGFYECYNELFSKNNYVKSIHDFEITIKRTINSINTNTKICFNDLDYYT
jgi:hypothetical protein